MKSEPVSIIQEHVFVVDRVKMLRSEDAKEQGIIVDGANFLNSADLDGKQLPLSGAPNIVLATGGSQLNNVTKDDGDLRMEVPCGLGRRGQDEVDGTGEDPGRTLRVPRWRSVDEDRASAGTNQRLDSQGDKLMARVVYRRIGDRESIDAVHSINTSAGGGGVRWYEFRLNAKRDVELYQQGTYAPGGDYRWMAGPAIDAAGNAEDSFCRGLMGNRGRS